MAEEGAYATMDLHNYAKNRAGRAQSENIDPGSNTHVSADTGLSEVTSLQEQSKHSDSNTQNGEETDSRLSILHPFYEYERVMAPKDKSNFLSEEVMHFKCRECAFQTWKEFQFRCHVMTHCRLRGNQLIKCPDCDYVTKYKSNMKTHLKRHVDLNDFDEKEIFRCLQCDYKTFNKHDLDTHERKHFLQKPYKCELCEFSTIYKQSLIHHMDSKHVKRRPFKCTLCPYSASRKQDLTTHIFKHSKTKPFNCDICGFSTAYQQTYKSHMNNHAGKRNYKCNYENCTYAATNKANLTAHLVTHKPTKRFNCRFCSYSSSQKRNLLVHELGKHMPSCHKEASSKHFKCDQCDFVTAQKFSLTRHMKTHDPDRVLPEKKFSCEFCHYKTAYKPTLKRHMATHSAIKPFKCGYCEYSAINMSQMHVHIAKHTGIKPYKCLHCDYSTANKQHLLEHGAKHAGIHLKCSICNFTTAWKNRMRIHMKNHTAEEKAANPTTREETSVVCSLSQTDRQTSKSSRQQRKGDEAPPTSHDHSYIILGSAFGDCSEGSCLGGGNISAGGMKAVGEETLQLVMNLCSGDSPSQSSEQREGDIQIVPMESISEDVFNSECPSIVAETVDECRLISDARLAVEQEIQKVRSHISPEVVVTPSTEPCGLVKKLSASLEEFLPSPNSELVDKGISDPVANLRKVRLGSKKKKMSREVVEALGPRKSQRLKGKLS